MVPLRPRTQGRSVPIPPLIPSVAIAGLVLGLVLGFGLAPKPGPAPGNGSLASIAAYIPASAAPAVTVLGLPPAGGLTLTEALAALKLADVGTDSPSSILSARIARYGDAAFGAVPGDSWVWAFVVRRTLGPAPGASELAIFDYQTGRFLEDRIPAYP